MPRPVICGWRLVWVTGTPSPSRRSPAPCPPPLRARLLLCLEGERPRPRRRGFHPGSRTRSSRLQPPRFALFWRREKRWGKGIAPPPPLCGSVGTRVRVSPPPPRPAAAGDEGIPRKPPPARLSPRRADTRGEDHRRAPPAWPGGSARGRPRPAAPGGGGGSTPSAGAAAPVGGWARPRCPAPRTSPPGGSAEPGRCSPGSGPRRRGFRGELRFPGPPAARPGRGKGRAVNQCASAGVATRGSPPPPRPPPRPANNKCFRGLKAGRQVSCGRAVRG